MRGIANEKLGTLFTFQKTHWKANYSCVNVLSKLCLPFYISELPRKFMLLSLQRKCTPPFLKKGWEKIDIKVFSFPKEKDNYLLFLFKTYQVVHFLSLIIF